MADVERIENGTYKGECLLDCEETIVVTPSTLTYSLTSPFPDAAHPDIRVELALQPSSWQQLVSLLDLDALRSLSPPPDAADASDAGGEFVAVSDGQSVTRRDFALGTTPGRLAPLLQRLRELRAELAQRHGR